MLKVYELVFGDIEVHVLFCLFGLVVEILFDVVCFERDGEWVWDIVLWVAYECGVVVGVEEWV